ncbi:hypothetical protein FA15DRAFT_444689 [Coprinopsis marcescibilis]|uniref:Uncharacterized protein n=1 Tax=Coprinopsis marcescibilis TaxID=230819 RepID=A0A5C3KTH3_COPMA|nr:hypothetical protein FA15DRAFT_444689 [Coprinopsis marcescibilis]
MFCCITLHIYFSFSSVPTVPIRHPSFLLLHCSLILLDTRHNLTLTTTRTLKAKVHRFRHFIFGASHGGSSQLEPQTSGNPSNKKRKLLSDAEDYIDITDESASESTGTGRPTKRSRAKQATSSAATSTTDSAPDAVLVPEPLHVELGWLFSDDVWDEFAASIKRDEKFVEKQWEQTFPTTRPTRTNEIPVILQRMIQDSSLLHISVLHFRLIKKMRSKDGMGADHPRWTRPFKVSQRQLTTDLRFIPWK